MYVDLMFCQFFLAINLKQSISDEIREFDLGLAGLWFSLDYWFSLEFWFMQRAWTIKLGSLTWDWLSWVSLEFSFSPQIV
jgi:hypothetical protein